LTNITRLITIAIAN